MDHFVELLDHARFPGMASAWPTLYQCGVLASVLLPAQRMSSFSFMWQMTHKVHDDPQFDSQHSCIYISTVANAN